MKKIILFLLIIGLWAPLTRSQEFEFPFPVLPGERFTVPAKYDTVWLLKNTQYKNAIKIAMKQEIDSALVNLLEKKIKLLYDIAAEKDSIIALNRRGYLHYRDLWEETDLKLEEEEIKSARRWRFGLYGFYIGVGLTAGTVAAFKLIK